MKMASKEPEWAEPPPQHLEWNLVEIKGGVEIAKHSLSRACTILGRARERVNIVLQHESCSRLHAFIAFDSSGVAWLSDLSTHGTTRNGKAIGQVERIGEGDLLAFGASSRVFLVELVKIDNNQTTATEGEPNIEELQNHFPQESVQEVSWGIDMEDYDQGRTSSLTHKHRQQVSMLNDLEVPEKLRKDYERLHALKCKLSNMRTEDERIKRKGELTEGQERQLQRNSEREEMLTQSIEALENELYEKLYPDRKETSSSNRLLRRHLHSNNQDIDEDADDFYDRTKSRRDESVVENNGESEKSLTNKWKLLCKQLKLFTGDLKKAMEHQSILEERLVKAQKVGSDEVFFIENDLQISKESLEKIESQQSAVQVSMLEVERLLKIVNAKLQIDRTTGYVGEGLPPPPEKEQSEARASSLSETLPLVNGSYDQRTEPIESVASPMPPPALPPSQETSSTSHNPMSNRKPVVDDHVMPPPKRQRVAGPRKPPDTHDTDSSPETMYITPNRPRQGTLEILASMNRQSFGELSSDSAIPGSQKKTKGTVLGVSDTKNDEWSAPQGQDGSGITKLNAKFMGRY